VASALTACSRWWVAIGAVPIRSTWTLQAGGLVGRWHVAWLCAPAPAAEPPTIEIRFWAGLLTPPAADISEIGFRGGSFTRRPEDSAAHTAPVSAEPAWDAAAAAGRRVRSTRAHRAPTGRKRGPVAGHTCSSTSPAQRHLVPVPALLAPAARTNRSILLLDVSVWECTGRSRSATASANTPRGGLRVSAGMRSGVRSGWRAGIRIACQRLVACRVIVSGRAEWFCSAGMAEILAGSRWSQYRPRGRRGGRHEMT
jgi:hypothetical protein